MSASRHRAKAERADTAAAIFPALSDDWVHITEKGRPVANLANTLHALRFRPELRGLFRHDEMARTTMLTGPIPGNAAAPPFSPRPVRDVDVSALQERLQHLGLERVTREVVFQAVEQRASECAFHPVRDYLAGLQWDGKPRVETWLRRYLGAADSEYVRGIGTMFLVAMVARVLNPGCKCDYMVVLEGMQGAGKSTACRILGGNWFSDNLPPLHGDPVRLSQHLRGRWLIEVSELSALGKAEAAELKAFVSRPVETFTPKYAKCEAHEPRQCLFVGTTNAAAYLRDETGGRRFWPVRVGTVDTEMLARDRDQLFAEAVALYRAGQAWWPEGGFEAEHIAPEQEKRYEADAWEGAIAAFLRGKDRVTVDEVARGALFITVDRLGTADQRRVGKTLVRLGWGQGTRGGAGQRFYYEPGDPRRDDADAR